MYVKAHSAPANPGARISETKQGRIPMGIPGASVTIADGDSVVMLVRWHDCHDIPETLCSVRMSPTEARALGERLIAAAGAKL